MVIVDLYFILFYAAIILKKIYMKNSAINKKPPTVL